MGCCNNRFVGNIYSILRKTNFNNLFHFFFVLFCLGGMSSSPMLQYVRLPIVDTHTCAESYAKFSANSRTPIIISDDQVCVQGTANRDACQGIDDILSEIGKSNRLLIFCFVFNFR